MKDPYLKPVILGGLLTTILSTIFAPAIFLWAIIGGYTSVRVANKLTKTIATTLDSVFLGLFSGIIGGTCLDIITFVSIKSPENKQLLIDTLVKNWPKNVPPIDDIQTLLPSLFITTSLLVIVITVVFSILGSLAGLLISNKKDKVAK